MTQCLRGSRGIVKCCFLHVVPLLAVDPALAGTNLLLQGMQTTLNLLLPSTIRFSGLDPYQKDFASQFEGPTLSLGMCKEATVHGSVNSMNLTGLSSATITEMEATSAKSNFFLTRIVAPTKIALVFGEGLLIEAHGEAAATCGAGRFGSFEVARTPMRTVSHVKGVDMLANVTLTLSLTTSTIKDAQVESVFITHDDVETSCSIAGGLGALCPVMDKQMSLQLNHLFAALSAQLKTVMQSSLDSLLPIGPGAFSSAAVPTNSSNLKAPGDMRRLLLRTTKSGAMDADIHV